MSTSDPARDPDRDPSRRSDASLSARLAASVERHGTRIALHEVRDGVTRIITYAELGRRVARHAAALDALAGEAASAQAVVVAGDGPDALVAELGVIVAGRVAVPAADAAHASTGIELAAAAGLTTLAVVSAAEASTAEANGATDTGVPVLPLVPPPGPAAARLGPRAVGDDSPALVLAQGGQAPLVFTHAHVLAGLDALAHLLPMRGGRRHVAHLPRAHAAARAFAWHALLHGAEHCWVSHLAELEALGPRVLVAAPEEVVGVAGRVLAPGRFGVRRAAGRAARSVERARAAGSPVSWLSRARHGLLEATVLAPRRAALGRPGIALCGGGVALPADVLDGYFAAGLPVYQAWTPPAAFGPVTCNTPDRVRFGTLGRPIQGARLVSEGSDGSVAGHAPWLCCPAVVPGRVDADGYLVPEHTYSARVTAPVTPG